MLEQNQPTLGDVKQRNWLLPGVLLAFVISAMLAGTFVWFVEQVRTNQAQNQARQLASVVAHDIGERLDRSLSSSYALATLVRQGKGRIDNFEALSMEMIRVYGGITALQLAPGGTIQKVVPLAGNEAVIGFSPLHDSKQGAETRSVIEKRALGLTGPFALKQGGVGVVGRYPIFLPDENGVEHFWGLTQVLIRIPDLLAATGLNALVEAGYAYELWRISPGEGGRHIFAQSGDASLIHPVEIKIAVPNGEWVLSVGPVAGWMSAANRVVDFMGAAVFCLLISFTVYLLLRQPRLLQQEVTRRTRELWASEAQYRSLFDSNPVPMVVYEVDSHRILDVNESFVGSYGYTRRELATMTLADLHPESDQERLAQYFSGPLHKGLRHVGEWLHRRKSGQAIDVELTSLEVVYEERKARLALAIDITDRKRVADELRVQNNRLKSVLAHFPGGLTVADAQTHLVEWNEQFRTLLDFPMELFVGPPHKIIDYVRYNARRGEYGDVDVDAYVAQAAAQINRHEAHHFERTRPDGTVLEVRGTPLPDGGVVSSYTDITERKRVEARLVAANQRYEELNAALEARVDERTLRLAAEVEERRLAESAVRRSAEWLREIIDTMSIGIVLWDKELRLVAWNEAFKRLYPASADLLRSGLRRQELRAAMAARGDAPGADDESANQDRLGRWDRRLPDGRVVNIERMETSEGGRLVLQTDVTSLRKTADVLARNERMASLGNLVAGIAHEINTPIGNARMVASTIGDRIVEFEEALAAGALRRSVLERFIAGVRESEDLLSRNLLRAANLIQNFKQVAVDQTSDRRRVFDLATVLEEIRMTLLPRFKQSRFALELEAEVGVTLDSYPGALGQVVSNLVENALVHAFDGRDSGRIVVTAHRLPDQRVEIVCADDGVGIPSELQQRVFDPFFTTKLGKGGSGLGLSIVLNLVRDLLGGEMVVESKAAGDADDADSVSRESGCGTRFIITLPCVAPRGRDDQADTAGLAEDFPID